MRKKPLPNEGAKVIYAKATVIVNPRASGARKPRDLTRVLKELRTCVRSVELIRTWQKEEAVRLAHEAVVKGNDLIVAIGGDGTINQVVNGLLGGKKSSGHDCVLGIIPAGATCSLAKELGIPRGIPSVRVLAEGTVKTIDLIRLRWATSEGHRKERLAVTVANFGFGGAVVETVGAEMKTLGGFLAFAAGATLQLFRYRGRRMAVEVDGKRIARSRVFCAIVANSQWEGGGMHVAPEASTDDGILDIVVVEDLPLLSRLTHFPKVYTGKHVGLPMVKCARGRRVLISATSPATRLPFEYDGEWAECRECSIEVLPKALSILVPKKSPRHGC
ncbi:diacylglycerol kinase family lipid kinase [bacterium]|nr:diacylglycerol kinase family lipid kinase [bacterium]